MEDGIEVTERAEQVTVNNEPLTTNGGDGAGDAEVGNGAEDKTPGPAGPPSLLKRVGDGNAGLPVVRGNLCESEPCDPFLMGLRSKY
jgi:hypothetical protein